MSDIKINVMNGKNPAFSVSMTDEQVRYCTNAANEHDNLVDQNKALRAALADLVKAEWMVSHDWGGDRKTVVDNANKALEQAK
ncbi:MAG: hypothetical protein V7765_21895 [Oleispira sp.]